MFIGKTEGMSEPPGRASEAHLVLVVVELGLLLGLQDGPALEQLLVLPTGPVVESTLWYSGGTFVACLELTTVLPEGWKLGLVLLFEPW